MEGLLSKKIFYAMRDSDANLITQGVLKMTIAPSWI